MSLAERIPILGHNPVFVYEAKRCWTRKRTALIAAGFVGIYAASLLGYYVGVTVLDRPGAGRIEPVVVLTTVALFPNAGVLLFATEDRRQPLGAMEVAFIALVVGGSIMGRYFGPALTARTVAQEREKRTLEPLAVTPLKPRDVLRGKAWATSLPLVLPFAIGAPWLAYQCWVTGGLSGYQVLGFLGWMLAEIGLGVYGSLAFSCICRKATTAVAAAYALVWMLPAALLIGGMMLCQWLHHYGRKYERTVVGTAFAVEAVVAFAAWLIARVRIHRLMRS